jgi:hypothetical protein
LLQHDAMNHAGNCSSERNDLLGTRIGCAGICCAMNKFASCFAATAVVAAGLGLAGLGSRVTRTDHPELVPRGFLGPVVGD